MAKSDTAVNAALSVGQVARRWKVDRGRVHALVRSGQLAAFTVPSAGRFGKALRIPLTAVLEAEAAWACLPEKPRPKPPPRGSAAYRHLKPRPADPAAVNP